MICYVKNIKFRRPAIIINPTLFIHIHICHIMPFCHIMSFCHIKANGYIISDTNKLWNGNEIQNDSELHNYFDISFRSFVSYFVEKKTEQKFKF